MTFNQQTQWIVNNEDDLNIVFVSQLGDITEHFDTVRQEFDRADAAMDTLDNAGIPNNLAPGNHDMSNPGAVTSDLWDEYFPPGRYNLPGQPVVRRLARRGGRPGPAPEQGQLRAVHGRRDRLPDHPPRDRHADVRRAVGRRDHRSLPGSPGDPEHPCVREHVERAPILARHDAGRRPVGRPGLDAAGRAELQRLHGRQRPLPGRGSADVDELVRAARPPGPDRLPEPRQRRRRLAALLHVPAEREHDRGVHVLAQARHVRERRDQPVRPGVRHDRAGRLRPHRDGRDHLRLHRLDAVAGPSAEHGLRVVRRDERRHRGPHQPDLDVHDRRAARATTRRSSPPCRTRPTPKATSST